MTKLTHWGARLRSCPHVQIGDDAIESFAPGLDDDAVTCEWCRDEIAKTLGAPLRPRPTILPPWPGQFWCWCPDPLPRPVRLFGVKMLAGWWECAHCRMPVPHEWHDHDGNLLPREAVAPA